MVFIVHSGRAERQLAHNPFPQSATASPLAGQSSCKRHVVGHILDDLGADLGVVFIVHSGRAERQLSHNPFPQSATASPLAGQSSCKRHVAGHILDDLEC